MIIQHFLISAAAEAAPAAGSPSFIQTLGLNWKLFLAQLVNFGVVLFILWRWVMKPVVGALESRRQKIEASVKHAAEIEERMKAFEATREQELHRARQQAEELLKKAAAVAETARQEMTAAARREADQILVAAKTAIEAEKQRMLREIREEVADLTLLATEKILREKLSGAKDRELISEVMKSLK